MSLRKRIDFTQPGGFPFTQDTLAYLQDSYSESIIAVIGNMGSVTGPMAVSGMAVTVPSPGTFTVTNGWFVYNGNMVKFTGSTVSPTGGDVALVEIAVTGTPLTFNDGSTPNVIFNSTATLLAAPTATDATHFPLSALVPVVPAWEALDAHLDALFDPGVSPRINVDRFGRVNFQGTIVANGSGAESVSAALPVKYRPDVDKYFTVTAQATDTTMRQVTLAVFADGSVFVWPGEGLTTDEILYLDAVQYLKA